jgi:hypothetical protein
MKNYGIYGGGILKCGVLRTSFHRYSPHPALVTVRAQIHSGPKQWLSLGLFMRRVFPYLRIIFLSLSPHGPHGGQHFPSYG